MKTKVLFGSGLVALFAQLTFAEVTAPQPIYEACSLADNGTECLNYPYETCQLKEVENFLTGGVSEQAICQHKPLLPLLSSEIFPTIFLPLLLGIASVAGVGGGMVIVPTAIGLFHFSSKEAIAVSTAIVFETAIIRFVFFSAWTKHPEQSQKTEIDYNTVRVVYPLFLVGAYFGVIFFILLSELYITVLIIVCLGSLSIQMIFKSRQKFMAETVKIAKEEAEANDDFQRVNQESQEPGQETAGNTKIQANEAATKATMDTEVDEQQPLLQDSATVELMVIEEREKSACSQWRVQLQTFGLTALSMVVNLVRGSPKNESILRIDKCGALSWALLGGFVLLCLLVTWWNVVQVRREVQLKRENNKLCASDIIVTDRRTLVFILIMSFVGSFLGNALGLGGGFIYNPVQLSLGVAPSVAASTSMYMIMFSAAASTCLLLIFGQVNVPYVLYLAISCGIGVILGMYFIGKLLKKWKRQSIVAICLAVILTFCTAFSGIMNTLGLLKQKENGLDIFTGGNLC